MKNLLFKELKLSIHPVVYFMPFLVVLLLIPEYPYFIAFMYVFITIPIIFTVCKEHKDIYFAVLLPVRKRDIVKARFMAVIAIELMQLLIAVPFAIINKVLYPQGNSVMLDVSMALFGFVFIIYAIFNAIFLPGFYKTANKMVLPVTLAVAAAFVFGVLVEFAVQAVPFFKLHFDTVGMLLGQAAILVLGIGIYIVSNHLAYGKAAGYFDKIDV